MLYFQKMAGESVLDYFWQEFAAIEWATDMTLGDMFENFGVSLCFIMNPVCIYFQIYT